MQCRQANGYIEAEAEPFMHWAALCTIPLIRALIDSGVPVKLHSAGRHYFKSNSVELAANRK